MSVRYSNTLTVGVSGMASTTSDITMYVATTGSDTTGDGSVGNPYATITKAHEQVPYVIRHKINIRIAAGAYTDFPRVMRHVAIGDGQLVMEGLGVPTVVAGPFTLTGVTDLGDARGWDLTVAAAGWGVDDYAGKFIRFTNGDSLTDRIVPVHSNSTDTLETLTTSTYAPDIPKAGTTFSIVEPSVEVTITDDNTVFDLVSDGTVRGANYIFANLLLSNPTTEQYAFCFNNTGRVITGLLKLSSMAQYNETLRVSGGSLNGSSITDFDWAQLINPQLVKSRIFMGAYYFTWASLVIENTYGAALDSDNPGIWMSGSQGSGWSGAPVLSRFSCRGVTNILDATGRMSHCRVGQLIVDHQGTFGGSAIAISLGAVAQVGIRVDDLSRVELQDVIITSTGSDAIKVEDHCQVLLENVDATTANVVGYGLRMGKGSRVVISDASTPTGSSGAIRFDQSAATVGYPAAPGLATDALGSDVIT